MIKIKVSKQNREVYLEKTIIGNDNENLQDTLVFEFTDSFVNGSARLDYELGGIKYHIPLTKEGETYTTPIKNVLAKEGTIYMQLVVVQSEIEEEIPLFKSNMFYMYCGKSINAQSEAPSQYEYWLDILQEKIAEVENLDIEAQRVSDGVNVIITDKDGVEHTTKVNDGTNGQDAKINGVNTLTIEEGENITIEQEGSTMTISATCGGLVDDVKVNGTSVVQDKVANVSVPTKTSDITNDSGFITKSVNNLDNYTKTSKLGSLATKDSVNYETEITNKPNIPTNADFTLNGLGEKSYNNLTDKPDLSVYALNSELTTEITNRENADNLKQDIMQYSTMPTASSSNVDKIVQFVGTTGTYTNGYFYKNVHTQVQESITATQTDNVVPLGTITLNNNTLKSQLNAGTHEFVYRPYDTVLNFMNMSVFPPVSYQITRDNTFDRQPMIPNVPKMYSWVDTNNNFYATDTLQPNALTKLYTLDVRTNDMEDTGATFVSSNTPSQIEGRWTKKEGDVYTDVEISDYGILLSSSGIPGNTIQVVYTQANDSYNWTNIDTTNISTKQDKLDNNLTTNNKNVVPAINEVNSIAKGSNQALGFTNYSTLISSFNNETSTKYRVGQNIYVITTEVPDLWVSSVEESSSTYTYTTDAQVINDLETNGYIQCGYYKLSMLETQKVDLTNYYTKSETTSQISSALTGYATETYVQQYFDSRNGNNISY